MNVDTADLTEVVRQVAELSRKVSCLTGRVTVMSNALNRADDGLIPVTAAFRLGMEIGDLDRTPRPAAPRPAARRPRHLRAIDGGQP